MASDHAPAGGRGLQHARDYFHGLVEPILGERCPGVPYAAARVGTGSEVLGLDDATSRDHDWGLRLQLFASEQDVPAVVSALDQYLPGSFHGHPVRFPFSGQQAARLGIDVMSPTEFAHDRLGFDPADGVTTSEWLSVTGQAALEVVAGEVFTDQVGELTRLRQSLSWYPDDLWRYVLACDWQRLNQELPLMARAGDRGDELGSRTIAARLVDIAVHLGFTLCRTWQPYSKWRGTRFTRLPVAPAVASHLQATVAAGDWSARNHALGAALERLAGFQSDVGLPSAAPALVPFWDRPYLQVDQSMVAALTEPIVDPRVRALAVGVGSIEQQTDNVDLLVDPVRRRAVVDAAHSVSA